MATTRTAPARVQAQAAIRTRRAKTIGLFGHFGSGNFGNEGSLDAMVRFLRGAQPAAELVCICATPDVAARDHGIPAHSITWHSKNARFRSIDRMFFKLPGALIDLAYKFNRVRRLDYLIIPGTGILDDFGTGPRGIPYGLFSWCLAARLMGVRTWYVSIGAGPIAHPLSRWLMKQAVNMADYRSYRDQISKDFVGSLGLNDAAAPVYPDIAFALPSPVAIDKHAGGIAPAQQNTNRPLCIGVGVMAYNGWRGDRATGTDIYETYMGRLTAFSLWLLDSGYTVRLFMGESTDDRALADLLGRIKTARPGTAPERILVEPAHSLHDIMTQLAGTDVVVATRFHNVVCALKVGKPVVSISYAAKNDVLLASVGLRDASQPIEKLDTGMLIEQVKRVIENRTALAAQIRNTVAAYRLHLLDQDRILASRLKADGIDARH
jgi:polysaccharide pyruvyl transferase WcaK-like protein